MSFKDEAAATAEQERKAEKRELIRRSAHRCFAERGYHQTTVDDICRAAGISKGSFYWYYESKQAIFFAILDTWGENVESELGRQFQTVMGIADAFKIVTAALAHEIRRNRRLMPVWLEFMAQCQRDQGVRKGLEAFHERIRRAIERLLDFVTSGTMPEPEQRVVSGLIRSAFIGLLCDDLVAGGDDAQTNARLEAGMTLIEGLVTGAMNARAGAQH